MSLFAPKEKVVYICVTDCERRIIINALKKLRDEQIKINKYYVFIAKSAKADTLKGTRKSYEER